MQNKAKKTILNAKNTFYDDNCDNISIHLINIALLSRTTYFGRIDSIELNHNCTNAKI